MVKSSTSVQSKLNAIDPFTNKLPDDYKTRSHSVDNIITFIDTIAERTHLTRLFKNTRLTNMMHNDLMRYIDCVDYIYNSLPLIMALLDSKLVFLAANKQLAKAKAMEVNEFIGRPVRELFPTLADEVFDALHSAVDSGRPILNQEVSAFTPAAPFTERHWSANFLPVIDGSGKTTSIMVTAHEITDSKRLELYLKAHSEEMERLVIERTKELELFNQKLKLNEERFRLVVSNSPVVLLMQDKELKHTWLMNPKMFPDSELAIGKTDDDLFLPEIADRLKSVKRKAMDTQSVVREEVLLANEDISIYVDLSVSPTYDVQGDLSGIACVATDVTQKKLMEIELRRSEERFQKAFNMSPAMMTISQFDDGTIIDANDTWLKVLGYSREEVIGRSPYELGMTDPAVFNILRQSIVNRSFNPEFKTKCKNGTWVSVITSSEKIEIDGEPCLLTFAMDVSRELKLQTQMARLDRLNLIGEMAASIGHEIRNPMTVVRGFLQMFSAKEEYQKDRSYFELMIEELDRANGILTEYLGMAKDKKLDLHSQSIDPIIISLSPIIQAEATRRDMNLRLNLNSPLKTMLDENEIRQIIINLAQNGLDAMKPGGTLTITTYSDTHIVLMVSDQGSGLQLNIIDKIGTPFLTTKTNGTGLGLAVCFSIAARHNAEIDFETGPEGTSFYIRFPLATQQD